MLGDLFNNPVSFLFWALSLIVAITIHEFAHAWSADRLGDPTPSLQGRLTLNPLAHLDPIGTLMLLFVHFGWGKPVQFDPYNLRHPQRDSAIISIAGPSANLILAIASAVVLQLLFVFRIPLLSYSFVSIFVYFFVAFLKTLITLNIVLAVFNLIPVHPLDGFKIVGGLLPADKAAEWYSLERYGMIFLLILLFPIFGSVAPINQIISPVISFILGMLLPGSQII